MQMGKFLKNAGNVMVLDATRKSGGEMGQRLAPSWELIKEWKESSQSDVDWMKFVREYRTGTLEKVDIETVRFLSMLCNQEFVDSEYLLVICYCQDHKHCHRTILGQWLEEETLFSFENLGEVTKDDIEIIDTYQITSFVYLPETTLTEDEICKSVKEQLMDAGIKEPNVEIVDKIEVSILLNKNTLYITREPIDDDSVWHNVISKDIKKAVKHSICHKIKVKSDNCPI